LPEPDDDAANAAAATADMHLRVAGLGEPGSGRIGGLLREGIGRHVQTTSQ